MLRHHLYGKKLVLASKSPRRHQLLQGLDVDFEVRTAEVDESFPPELRGAEIALYLAETKAEEYATALAEKEILITADTIVWINDMVLNKPADRSEAITMLNTLSGNWHSVYTGVCICSLERKIAFTDETRVLFHALSIQEIEYYVDHYKPFDKAGAYGAQDWIGFTAIACLEGSYFNVMGLPVHRVYQELMKF